MNTKNIIEVITKFTSEGLVNLQKNLNGFNTVMGKNLQQFKEVTTESGTLNKRFKNMNNAGAQLGHRIRMMTHGMRGFRMEMLGVMFFGMSLYRTMTSLIKTSLEWTGVTEILSETLGLLFLPIAEELLEWALLFLEWVNNLTEDQKKLIGVITLLVAGFGAILMVIGTLSLGIGSIIQAFGGFIGVGKIIEAISSLIIGLSSTVLIVIGVVVAVIAGMVIAWRNNFLNMRQTVSNVLEGIKQTFSGVWNIIKGIVNVILGILSGDFERFSEGIKQIFIGLKDFIVGIFKFIGNTIVAILKGALQIIVNIINLAFELGARIGNFLTGDGFSSKGALNIDLNKPITQNPTNTYSQESINVNYNITGVSSPDDIKKMLQENNRTLASEIRRSI